MEDKSIQFWDRQNQSLMEEKVYGEQAVRFLYENPIGQKLGKNLLSRHFFSKLYGALQSARLSRNKIPGFVKKFSIDISEYESKDWTSFNDFFTRRFLPGKRNFVSAKERMPAPCEARYLAYERVSCHEELPVKGVWLSVAPLLEKKEWIDVFSDGPAYIARLCPVDYHRFHFPDSGVVMAQYRASGPLESVNPTALKAKPDILFTNERLIQILKTENFGRLAFIPVGAICVGKIVMSHQGSNFNRGDGNGYFLFGGSTVVVLGEPGKWSIDNDILEKSKSGIESFIRLGEAIATTMGVVLVSMLVLLGTLA